MEGKVLLERKRVALGIHIAVLREINNSRMARQHQTCHRNVTFGCNLLTLVRSQIDFVENDVVIRYLLGIGFFQQILRETQHSLPYATRQSRVVEIEDLHGTHVLNRVPG